MAGWSLLAGLLRAVTVVGPAGTAGGTDAFFDARDAGVPGRLSRGRLVLSTSLISPSHSPILRSAVPS